MTSPCHLLLFLRVWYEVAFSYPLKHVSQLRWSLPPLRQVNLNYDGNAVGNPRPASVGGIIYDGECVNVLSFLGPTCQRSINKAKLHTMQIDLREANHMNMKQIIEEGDSML